MDGNFPGGPVVETSVSNAGGEGLIPDRGTRFQMSHGAARRKKTKSKKITLP